MKKRTEFLVVSLVLSGAAVAAAMTSDDGKAPTDTVAVAAPTALTEIPAPQPVDETDTTFAEPEEARSPIVYDMDIPADVMSDYEATSPRITEPLAPQTDDQIATDRTNADTSPSA